MISRAWRFALRNLSRNKRRNLATGASIAFGFAGLLILGGYQNRAENYLRVYTIFVARSGHLILYKKNGIDLHAAKPKEYSFNVQEQQTIQQALKQFPEIDHFSPLLTSTGLISNGCTAVPYIGTGIEKNLDHQLRSHPEVQRWAPQLGAVVSGKSIADYPDTLPGIALSVGLARTLKKEKTWNDLPTDGAQKPQIIDCSAPNASMQIASDTNIQLLSSTWNGGISAIDAENVALFSTGYTETDQASILAPMQLFQKLHDTASVTSYSLWIKNSQNLSQLRRSIADALSKNNLMIDLYEWDDPTINPYYAGTMGFLNSMIGFISLVLGAVIGLSIINSATITVIERSAELGTLRSIGFTQNSIRFLFLRETTLLTFFSLLLGGSLGTIAILSVNHSNIWFYPPGIAGGLQLLLIVNWKIVLGSALFISLVAWLATGFGTYRATRRAIPHLLGGSHR